MTLLDMVNHVRQEAGVAYPELTALTNASEETARIRGWIIREWERLQAERSDWLFMRKRFSQTLTVGNRVVPLITGLDRPLMRGATVRLLDSDESHIDVLDQEVFRATHQMGEARTESGRPKAITQDVEAQQLLVAPTPDAAYIVEFYGTKSIQTLSDDDDVPAFPATFHPLIEARALIRYGTFYAAPEVIARAQEAEDVLYSRLVEEMVPEVGF